MSELLITETSVPVRGLKRDFSFLHVTDVHLCLIGGGDTEARVAYNAPRINLFSRDGVRSDEYFPRFFEYAEQKGCDAVIMTGDITDTPSEPNIRRLYETVSGSKVPVIYVTGNHDWSFFDDYRTENAEKTYLHKFAAISGGRTDIGVYRLDGLNILTLDNGSGSFSEPQLSAYDRLEKEDTPLLVCFHVPIRAPRLSVETAKVWGSDLCIGDGIMEDRLKASDNTAAVLCGHVHFFHEENIGKVPQLVTGLGAEGMGRLVKLVPERV